MTRIQWLGEDNWRTTRKSFIILNKTPYSVSKQISGKDNLQACSDLRSLPPEKEESEILFCT